MVWSLVKNEGRWTTEKSNPIQTQGKEKRGASENEMGTGMGQLSIPSCEEKQVRSS